MPRTGRPSKMNLWSSDKVNSPACRPILKS